MLYGFVVPDSARLVEIKAVTAPSVRPRSIYRGPLDDFGVSTTEDSISDLIASDARFWDWVGAQIRMRRLSAEHRSEDGAVVRLKLSVSFIQSDGSLAILDEATGATSLITEEAWEFHKGASGYQDQNNPMALVDKFMTLTLELHKEMPNQIARILREISDTGKGALQTSAAESSRILQAAVEPLKAQLAMIDKSHAHETTRADKASDAVIRMLNSDSKKEPTSTVDDLIKLATAAPAILALVEKAKRGVN